MRASIAFIGATTTVAMFAGIGFVTYAIYVVTSAQHLLSVPAMAILACALVLMARDEITVIFADYLWAKVQYPTLQKCIIGFRTTQSGWLIPVQPKLPVTGLRRFIHYFGGRIRPIRVLHVVADDGDEVYIGWDFKVMHSQSDGQVILAGDKHFKFAKQLFADK